MSEEKKQDGVVNGYLTQYGKKTITIPPIPGITYDVINTETHWVKVIFGHKVLMLPPGYIVRLAGYKVWPFKRLLWKIKLRANPFINEVLKEESK